MELGLVTSGAITSDCVDGNDVPVLRRLPFLGRANRAPRHSRGRRCDPRAVRVPSASALRGGLFHPPVAPIATRR
ncbi:MAG: hypothetical protein R2991_13550 [Thermoanaerobaculia bacterium]